MPDLIILDLNLPKLDGFELLIHLRSSESTKYLPVVVLTGSKEENTRAKAYRFGATSYIQKPADVQQLVQAVRLIGLYWLTVNEPAPR